MYDLLCILESAFWQFSVALVLSSAAWTSQGSAKCGMRDAIKMNPEIFFRIIFMTKKEHILSEVFFISLFFLNFFQYSVKISRNESDTKKPQYNYKIELFSWFTNCRLNHFSRRQVPDIELKNYFFTFSSTLLHKKKKPFPNASFLHQIFTSPLLYIIIPGQA